MKLKSCVQTYGRRLSLSAPYGWNELRSWRRKTASSIHIVLNIENSLNNQGK